MSDLPGRPVSLPPTARAWVRDPVPESDAEPAASPAAEILHPVVRGLLGRCPRCGSGRLFGRFLKTTASCEACGQPFHHHRADDFPPYIVMFVVGHLIGFGIYTAEIRFDDFPLWLHVALWPSLAIVLSLALLQPVKGAVVGLQYGLKMHGFGGGTDEEDGAGERRSW